MNSKRMLMVRTSPPLHVKLLKCVHGDTTKSDEFCNYRSKQFLGQHNFSGSKTRQSRGSHSKLGREGGYVIPLGVM